ncbi:MAG: hypothetical protein K8R02_04475 [Anaerohalosphaeraceae bacterium]|nr:hypothetical protein [Anaerohalosphaeraceae bacterium]
MSIEFNALTATVVSAYPIIAPAIALLQQVNDDSPTAMPIKAVKKKNITAAVTAIVFTFKGI